MSRLSTLLLLSGCANATLFAFLLLRPPAAPAIADGASASPPPAASSAVAQSLAEAWQGVAGDAFDSAVAADTSSDPQLLARLRAAGFPPPLLRAIFNWRIDQRFANREAALLASQPPPEYWGSEYAYAFGTQDSPDLRAAQRQLRQEKAALLRSLLGDDAESPLAAAERARRFGALSPEKAAAVEALLADYTELRRPLQGGPVLPSDRAQLALLDAERERDLAALLTPAELRDYQLRASTVAHRLQRNLSDFTVTESEYTALYAIAADFDAQWGQSSAGLTREDLARRTAAMDAMAAQVTDLLGPERSAEYKLKSDSHYVPLKALAENLDLPAESALATVSLRLTVQDERSAIARNRSLTPAQRDAQLAELQNRVRLQVTEHLTAEGAIAYEQSLGSWITALAPAAKPGP